MEVPPLVTAEIWYTLRETDQKMHIAENAADADLEPDGSGAVEGSGGARCLGHVDVDDTRVVNGAVALDAELRASSDVDRGGSAAGGRVVAAEVGACNVSNLGMDGVCISDWVRVQR